MPTQNPIRPTMNHNARKPELLNGLSSPGSDGTPKDEHCIIPACV